MSSSFVNELCFQSVFPSFMSTTTGSYWKMLRKENFGKNVRIVILTVLLLIPDLVSCRNNVSSLSCRNRNVYSCCHPLSMWDHKVLLRPETLLRVVCICVCERRRESRRGKNVYWGRWGRSFADFWAAVVLLTTRCASPELWKFTLLFFFSDEALE